MKVFLLTHDTKVSLGVGRYSFEIYNSIKNYYETEIIGNNSIPQYLDDLANIPIQVIIKTMRNKNALYHALSPREAIYLPLLTKRNVVTFHDILPLTNYHYPKFKLSQFYYSLVWRIAKKCGYIIADSSLTRDELIKKLKVDPGKITVINLGISKKFRPMKRRNKNELVVGYLGSMVKRKRVDIVIKSFKIFQQNHPEIACKLLIGGEAHKHLESFDQRNLIKTMDVKNVEILGLIPENKIVSTYNMFDVFVYPCDYDGWSLPILEAQKCGVPVITKVSSQLPEEIKKFTIQCKDEKEISETLYNLSTNKTYKRSIVEKAIEYVKRFNWDHYIEKLIEVYETL